MGTVFRTMSTGSSISQKQCFATMPAEIQEKILKDVVVFPGGVTVKGPETLQLMKSKAFTREIEGCAAFLRGKNNNSPHLRSLALEIFFTENNFTVASTMLPAFLNLKVGSQKKISFRIRSAIRKLKIDVYFKWDWHTRNRDVGLDLRGLRSCPNLRSLHVVVQSVEWYNYLDFDVERTIVQIWTVIEEMKERLGQGLTVKMKAIRCEPFDYPVCILTGRIMDADDEPRIFNGPDLVWLSRKYKMDVDVTWMWEAPTDAIKNKYLNSTHNWMEELTVLMFDEEANKEARVKFDTDARPLTKYMDMLKARPAMVWIMKRSFNVRKFRNSRLITQQAFPLVDQRFESTGSSTAPVLSS